VLRLGLIVAASVALAGCGGAKLANVPPSPERPGTRVTTKNPNPEKWEAVRAAGSTSGAAFFVCKPLACADRAAVAVQLGRSPTRNPDRAALEKAAKLLATQTRAQDMVMEAASEGDDRVAPLSSSVTELRGYQAIVAESKRTSRGKVSYVVRGDIFVGLLMVRVLSSSTVRADARKHFDSFVEAMDIIDFEAPPGSAPPAAPAAPATSLSEALSRYQ
jgi:hypothetical protein